MSDYSVRAPKISNAQRESEGIYQRFLSWLSMSKPGLWRLRIDIMVINYLVLGIAALLSPILLQPIAGIERYAACGRGGPAIGTCADSITVNYGTDTYYTWTNGFSASDIMWTMVVFIIASFILTFIWAFFVSRGTRLRGLVVQSSYPGFLMVLLVLAPMVILPMLAGHSIFVVTHGGGFSTMFTGVVGAMAEGGTAFEIAFPGDRHSQYSDRLFSQTSQALFLFGSFFAFIIAICMKIILADGVLGLVKSTVIAGILAALTVAIGLFIFNGNINQATFVQLSMLTVFGVLYYMWFRMSLVRNKRSKLSRTIGLSFCLYWIGWFPLVVIYSIQYYLQMGFPEIDINPWWIVAIFCIFYALFLSFTFRDISRINLLPQP